MFRFSFFTHKNKNTTKKAPVYPIYFNEMHKDISLKEFTKENEYVKMLREEINEQWAEEIIVNENIHQKDLLDITHMVTEKIQVEEDELKQEIKETIQGEEDELKQEIKEMREELRDEISEEIKEKLREQLQQTLTRYVDGKLYDSCIKNKTENPSVRMYDAIYVSEVMLNSFILGTFIGCFMNVFVRYVLN